MIGMLILTLAVVPMSTKYGIDSIAASKPQFGNRGWLITVVLQYASIIGWNCVLIILLGNATAEVLATGGLIGEDMKHLVQVVVSLATIGVAFWMVIGGADSVRDNSVWIAVAVAATGAIVLFMLISQTGWDKITAGAPAYDTGDLHLNYTLGFEILVATVLSWWPYMGGIMRMGKSVSQALLPSMICLGLITGLIGLIGLYASLATGEPDPSVAFVQVTGLWMGIVAVIFIALANIGTAIVGVYATMIGLKQVPAFQFRLSWRWMAILALGPVAFIAAVLPDWFSANILTFMYLLGLVFAPICGIQIVDYYVFRRQKLDVPALYDYTPSGKYHFWLGINWVAFIAAAVGFLVYWVLLDPVTYENRLILGDVNVFKYLSASIPSIVASGAVYAILTALVVKPLKRGGYE
jgi:NCS1 family nucleobase:cation symporter-1